MKLLFVHEVGYLSKPIFEMHEFPELLALRGHEITFLQFDEGRKFWRRARASHGPIQGRTEPGAQIILETPFQLGIPGLDRLLATLTIFPLLLSLLSKTKFDAIALYAVPTYGWQTILFARFFKVPVLFRALDVSHKIRKSVFSPLIKICEKYIYKNAEILSANNPAMADYCVSISKRSKQTLTQLPPLDLSHFKPLKSISRELANEYGISDSDKVIAYMGSFFYFSGLKQVIQSFADQATKLEKNLKLLLIGGGEQDAALRELVKRLGLLDRVIFTGFVDYQRLGGYLSLADVAINPMIPGLVSNTAFPHKMLQYMALGIPTVSTKLVGLYKTFGDQSGISWVESPADVFASAAKLSLDAKRCNELAKKQLAIVTSRFGVKSAVDAFESTLMEVTK